MWQREKRTRQIERANKKDSFYELWLEYSKIHQCILDARVPFHFLMLTRSICYANATWMINYSAWYPIWFICSTLFLVSMHSSLLSLSLFSTYTFPHVTWLFRAQLFPSKIISSAHRGLVNGARLDNGYWVSSLFEFEQNNSALLFSIKSRFQL